MANYEKPIIHGIDSNGNKVPVKVASDGTVATSGGGGGGGGGGGDASAAKQDEQTALLTTIDSNLASIKSNDDLFTGSNNTLLSNIENNTNNSESHLQNINNTLGSVGNTEAPSDASGFDFYQYLIRVLRYGWKLKDGLFDYVATIKNALVQPTLSDTAVVVTNRNDVAVTGSSTLNALNSSLVLDCESFYSVSLFFQDILNGTVSFQASPDNVNWNSIFFNKANGLLSSSYDIQAVNPLGLYYGVTPLRYFRVVVSGYTSGSTTVSYKLSRYQIPSDVIKYALTLQNVQNVGAVNSVANTVPAAVEGKVPHDTAVLNANPVLAGGTAISSWFTTVQNNDICRFTSDLIGRQIIQPFAPPELTIQAVTTAITGTANTQLFAANITHRNYLTSINIANDSNISTLVEVKDGTTVIARVFAPALDNKKVAFNPPLRGSLNTVINVANITTGSSTYVTGTGFISTI